MWRRDHVFFQLKPKSWNWLELLLHGGPLRIDSLTSVFFFGLHCIWYYRIPTVVHCAILSNYYKNSYYYTVVGAGVQCVDTQGNVVVAACAYNNYINNKTSVVYSSHGYTGNHCLAVIKLSYSPMPFGRVLIMHLLCSWTRLLSVCQGYQAIPSGGQTSLSVACVRGWATTFFVMCPCPVYCWGGGDTKSDSMFTWNAALQYQHN